MKTTFYTATIEHRLPGPPTEMEAIAYNLQYTAPLVADLVDGNPPTDTDHQSVPFADHELVRANLFGNHPTDAARRLCVIGVADSDQRASSAAESAWYDYHASLLFTDLLPEHESYALSIRHRIPGVPAQRAATVGVAYKLHYMRPEVEAAVARNMPTTDEVHVVQSGELTLMRVNLHGRHPLDSSRSVCVGGIADRHYRAMAAAEQAWKDYHTSLLFSAHALGSS
jgi:hypothetical protein